ncbi:hypothetical protein [Amycolatopsis sp. CA-230715]|uniref:hypothetical protein n=1 Tax=Amycolatopsis sp. CA-230715 TaxID=2745196 RepID=UPI001C030218|nr:hypothetical protein [Amycolatopsis sp. CA-230715]
MPDAVESLHTNVNSAVTSMGEANGLMTRLRNANDSVWQGSAGDAFRQHFNTSLADDLDHSHQSLTKAVEVIRGWHTDLLSFKDTATKLEHEAAAARQQQQQAETALQQAKANPDLKLADQQFSDDTALQQAQTRLNAAEAGIRNATTAATTAEDTLNDVIRRAKELQTHHEDTARNAAKALKDATHDLAPEKPGLFSRMFHSFVDAVKSVGDWVKNHLKDIHAVLSTISAVAGLVALVTPPPIDAIALGVSVTAGAGALATDLGDPKFRHNMGQLLTGHINKETLGTLMTGAADIASVIPGIGVGAKALRSGEAAAEGMTGAARITDLASTAAHQPGLLVKGMDKINPLTKLGELGQTGKIAEQANSFVDKMLTPAFSKLGEAGQAIENVDRLNFLWRVRGVGSNIKNDIHQATS